MEIGFPFMGDRLSLCRYSWAKRLTVYSFIFSFLWVSFPRYSYSFVPAIAAVAARAVIPKVVGRVLVRRFAANDAIYTASQLTATRVFVGRAAANAAEYLPAASSYKMSGVATWAGIAAAVSSFVPSSLSSSDGSVMVMTNGKKISDNLYEVTYSGQSGESKTITVNFEPQELSPVILHVSRNNVDAGSPVVGVETGYSTPDNALYYYQDSKELIYYYGDNPTEIARNYLNDYNSRTYTETFALYFVVQGFVEILVELLPDSSNLSSLFANLSDGFWYFINLSKLPQGISMIISAMATRFIIRRIPVIG